MLAFLCATLFAATATHAAYAAPAVMITSPANSAVIGSPSVPVSFDAIGDGALDFTCTVDTGPGTPCTSPFMATALADGTHSVEVLATDALLETGSDTVTFTVDTQPPDVSISSPIPAASFDSDSLTFEFSATDDHLFSVECSAAGGPFNSCSSGVTFSGLAEGPVTLQVRALDAGGNMATASVTVTLDRTDPSLAISLPADGEHVATGSPEIEFSATDANAVATECAADAGAFAPCTSPHFPDALSDGVHSVSVRATDLAGNSVTDSVSFTVDRVTPTLQMLGPADGELIGSGAVDVTFNVSDANLETVDCELDFGGAQACTSPWSLTGLSEGSHFVMVAAFDQAGNDATGSVSFIVDTTPPAVSISAPANGSYNATGAFNVDFSATDANGVTTECRVDGGAYAPCTSPFAVSGLSGGSHTVDVLATDGADNTQTASVSVTVDTTPPNVSIAAPTAGQHLSTGSTNLTFTATDTNPGSTTCSVDGGAATACTSPRALSGLGNGSHTATVTSVDLAGNSSSASVTFVVDTTLPTVNITSPADASFFATGSVNVDFTATDANLSSVQCQLDTGAYSNCTSPLALTGLAEGAHTVNVRATDQAGNIGTDSVSFTIESLAPVVTISSPTPGQYFNSTSVAVSFTATDTNLQQVRCSIDGGPFQNCTSPRTYTGLSQGAHTVSVRATDKSGNETIASVTFHVDTIVPAVAISAPTAGQQLATTSTNVVFTATDANALTIECRLDGGAYAACSSPFALSGLGQGSHTVDIRATDPAGNVSSASRSFVVDTTAPAVAIAYPTDDQVFTIDDVPIAFTATDTNLASVQCRADTGAYTACTNGYVFNNLPAGAHTLQVRATDQAGNVGTASVNILIDLADPVVTFSSPTAGAHLASTSVAVAFSATDASLVSVECDVDGGGFSPCTSPLSLTGLSQGSHTVQVRATDAANRTTTASRSFTVDTVVPTVSISSPAAGQFFSVDDIPFTFSAADANLTAVECRVDSGSYSACTSTHIFNNLAEGSRTLQVRATDQAGNSASASVAITVDLTDPAVSISAPAAGAHVASTSLNVVFSATDANLASIECNVDSAGFSPCTSPLALTGLAQGAHSVVVRATDAAGRSTSVTRNFTVDTIAPSVSISSPANGAFIDSTTVPVAFSATDTNLASVTCSIDGGAFSACTSPRSYSGLGQGSHTVVVRGTDQAGNSADASVTFTVDSIDPSVSITYPAAGQYVANTNVGVTFTATDANSLNVVCQIDGGAFSACSSPLNLTGLSQGSHTVVVRATDPAGNQTEVSRTFTVDTIAPNVSISSPTSGQYFNSTTVASSFTATDANGVTTTCRLDSGAFQPCSSPASATSLSQGDHTLTVRAVDPAGNSAEAAVTFRVDTVFPVVNVNAPTAGQHVASTSLNVLFTATDTNPLTVECNVDGAGFSTCTSPLALSGLAQGAHSVIVRATDPAGNVTSVTRNFTVDTVAPAVSISSPTAGQIFASTTVPVAFTATDTNLASVTCSIDGGAFSACTSPRSYTSLTQGDHTVVVRGTDQAGNFTEDDVTFRVDTVAPALTIDSPANSSFINSTSVNVAFTTSDANADTVECRLDSGSFAACTSPHALSGLAQGAHTVQVRATDRAGNQTTRSVSFTVDTIAPTVSISSPAPGTFVDSTTVTASFTASDANSLTIECRLDTDAFVGCSSPASVTGVPQGLHTITVRATDPAGNTSSAVTTVTVDSIDPSVTLNTPAAGAYVPSSSVSVGFTATDVNLSDVECRLDTGTFADCTSTYELSSLTEGAHTVTVRATDLANNVTQVSRSFTVDTVDPAVSISNPDPGDFLDVASVTAQFNANDTNLLTVRCSLDGGTPVVCSNNFPVSSLSDGDHTISVEAEDRAGNTATASVTFNVDTLVPTLTVTTPTNNQYINVDDSPNAQFAAIDGNRDAVTCAIDGGTSFDCSGPGNNLTADISGLGDGAHSIFIEVTDRAGNATSTTRSFTVDTIDPAVAITAPGTGSFFAVDTVSKTFTRSDVNLDEVECRFDGGSFAACSSPVDYTGLSEGLHTSEVRATDLAGNSTTRSIQFTVDTIAPQLSISSPAVGQTVFASDVAVAFSGVDATALSYECSSNGGAFGACGNPFTIGGLAEGGHSAQIRATDRAGNTSSSSVSFSVDLTSPDRGEQFGTAKPVGKSPLKFTKKRRLIWRDEFNGNSLNRRKWSNQRGTLKFPYASAYNPKIESAEYARENVAVQNGRAVLTLKRNTAAGDTTKPYSSGMIQSGNHFSFQYGYVEARVLVPKCVGCWPAFWMLNAPVDDEWPPEIDIFEFFNTTKDKRPKVNFHWKAGSRHKKWGSKPYGPRRNYVGGWHTYGLAWTKKSAQVFVDGKPGPIFKNSRALPKKPNYLIFNLALQKGFSPTGERRMMVDYVRVWQ